MKTLTRPKACPQCGGKSIKRIIGGQPNSEGMQMIESGEAVSGDSFLKEWKEDWHCTECSNEWCDKDDPARIEMEDEINKLLMEFNKGRS